MVCNTDVWRAGRRDSQYDPEAAPLLLRGRVLCAQAGETEKVSGMLAQGGGDLVSRICVWDHKQAKGAVSGFEEDTKV